MAGTARGKVLGTWRVQTRADGAGSRPSVIESSDPSFVAVPDGYYRIIIIEYTVSLLDVDLVVHCLSRFTPSFLPYIFPTLRDQV